MVPDSTLHARFTKMSLAVAKDSGLYDVDLSLGEEFYFAHGQSCRVHSKKCPRRVADFCSASASGSTYCSRNHDYVTMCRSGTFPGTECGIKQSSTYCKKEKLESGAFYEYGMEAKCSEYQVRIWDVCV